MMYKGVTMLKNQFLKKSYSNSFNSLKKARKNNNIIKKYILNNFHDHFPLLLNTYDTLQFQETSSVTSTAI